MNIIHSNSNNRKMMDRTLGALLPRNQRDGQSKGSLKVSSTRFLGSRDRHVRSSRGVTGRRAIVERKMNGAETKRIDVIFHPVILLAAVLLPDSLPAADSHHPAWQAANAPHATQFPIASNHDGGAPRDSPKRARHR
jgi:hypothetical protein